MEPKGPSSYFLLSLRRFFLMDVIKTWLSFSRSKDEILTRTLEILIRCSAYFSSFFPPSLFLSFFFFLSLPLPVRPYRRIVIIL